MFKTFFLKEISMGLKRPMLYIFLGVFTIIATIGVINLDITFGDASGSVLKNAPHVMTLYIANMSIIGLLIATTYFNNAALRDYQNNFEGILFCTPINKASYFFGRFFGALFLATIPLLGIFIGFSMGTNMSIEGNMASASRMGILTSNAFINNYFLFVLPNMFVSGAIIFAVANKWKSTIVSFIATIVIIVAYLISGTFINDMSTESLGALTDIMGLRAYTIDSKYFTTIDKNTQVVSFSGWLLINRSFWVIIGVITLLISYVSFSFIQKQQKVKNERKKEKAKITFQTFNLPEVHANFNFQASYLQFLSIFKINFYTILKSNTFKILLFFGALILINKLLNGFEYYGLQSYHVTNKMLAFNRPISMIMGIIILIFFSGELIWKERTSAINEVIDSTPHSSLTILLAKIGALITISLLFDLLLIIISIIYQLLHGYVHLEIDVYLLDFLYAGVPMYVIWSCILVSLQIFINNKYLAYFVSVLLIFLVEFLVVDALGIASFMVNLGFSPSYTYSDLNGFGAVLTATNWFNLYWVLFGALLITIASLFWIRGTSKGIRNRFKSVKKHFTKKYAFSFVTCLLLFGVTSSFVYYNTQVLNSYNSTDEIKTMQESYEKKYKKYESVLQPKITEIQYNVDIFPEERRVLSTSVLTIENKGIHTIDSLHYSLFYFMEEGNEGFEYKKSNWIKKLTIPNSKLVFNDEILGYQIFKLNTPLAPNTTMTIIVDTEYISTGFENSISNIRVARNGTFFESTYLLPSFGYEPYNELMSVTDRKKVGLHPKKAMVSLKNKNSEKLKENYITRKTSDWVQVETIISTSKDQIAISPGSLIKQWSIGERKYYKYKNDHQSINFINFMSARYEVAKKIWNGIDLEVYYHKAHDYNIDIMLNALEKSLQYYTENFGEYFHKQARIVEIPRYYNFAQAFPGTMPYTEGAGFITDLRDQNDNNVIYSIVAHEMAHQYWGHQLVGANVEGATMLSESFAEYSALMVMKNELNDDEQMKKFLNYDFEKYLKGRSNETKKETPLYRVGDQGYIHYGKGSVILYALQDYIGEEKVNRALKAFLSKYRYTSDIYPTTLDFINFLKPEIPDDFKYILTDWFKEITLYDYKLNEATYTAIENNKYQVNIDISASKIKVDSLGVESENIPYNWVDIAIYSSNDKIQYLKRILFNKEKMKFSFKVENAPTKVIIDPKRLLIEKVIHDNVRIIKNVE